MTRKLEIIKDVANEQLIFHKAQDVYSIQEANRIERDAGPQDLAFGRKVASVPLDILDHWITEGIDYRKIKKDPAMRKKFWAKLNSREFNSFKTYAGSIGQ